MLDTNTPIDNERFLKALDLLKTKKATQAEVEFKAGLQNAEDSGDDYSEALFCTGLGLLYQTQDNEIKAAKYFEKAEKILPSEPQLKIISARLLMDAFGQSEAAIRRCNKILHDSDRPYLRHQAENILGLAQLKLGDKAAAAKALKKAAEEIEYFSMLEELDLSLLQALLKRNLAFPEAKIFLEAAIQLAQKTEQPQEEDFFNKILEALEE